jgi:hypothetical protein
MYEVHVLVDRFVRCRHAAAARGHLEIIAARAVDLAQEVDEARVFPFLGSFV